MVRAYVMSVVNKMLKDLEARQSKTDEIKTDYHQPQKKQSKLLIITLLTLAISASVFAIIDKDLLFSDTKNIEVTHPTNIQPSLPDTVNKTPVNQEDILQQPQIPAATKARSDSAIEQIIDPGVSLVNNPLHKDEERNVPDEPKKVSGIQASLQKTETQSKQLSTPKSTELKTQTTPEQEQASRFSMNNSKQKNNTNSLKQRIAENLNNDNFDLAQSLLSQLLAIEPANIKARKKLASLLFAQGNYTQSKQILIRGIELHPAQSDLRLMLARLFVVQKKPQQAMNILTEFEPRIGKKIEYLAYRAALAQQLKQTELARSDYQTLTNIETNNAKWWLGLAITRDQLGEMNMALQAYNKANSLGQLDSSVNSFIQQRITLLAGSR